MATEYYYTRGGKRYGPLTSAQLRDLATKGRLKPSDLVWREGLPEWVPAKSIKGLFGRPGRAPVSPPQPDAGFNESSTGNLQLNKLVEVWNSHKTLVLGGVVAFACCLFLAIIALSTGETSNVQTGSLQIRIDGDRIFINNKDATLPTDLETFVRILGKPSRHTEALMTRSSVWDDLGIYIWQLRADDRVKGVFVVYGPPTGEFDDWPKSTFSGELILDGAPVTSRSTIESINAAKEGTAFTGSYRQGEKLIVDVTTGKGMFADPSKPIMKLSFLVR